MPEPQCDLTCGGPCFFTDGSCRFPNDRNARCSTFAIVAPTIPLADLDNFAHLPVAQLASAVFHVVAVAFVQGVANIDRAELQAVVMAHETGEEKTVYTDSSYVLRCFNLIQHTATAARLHKRKNADLLLRWHVLHWNRNLCTPTIKVKAHLARTSRDQQDPRLTMGNEVADWIAKRALATMTPDYTQMQQQIHDEQRVYADKLSNQYRMRTDLGCFRQALLNTQLVEDTSPPDTTLHRFQTWSLPQTHVFSTMDMEATEVEAAIRASLWGVQYSDSIVQWLATLRWPTDLEETDPGISWLELLVNFELLTQQVTPLLFPTAEGGKAYRSYTTVQGWTRDQCNLHDYLYSFQACIAHLGKLMNVPLLPDNRSKVKSIYQLGAGAGHRGIAIRPVMQMQEATMELVQDFHNQTPTLQDELHCQRYLGGSPVSHQDLMTL
eukprot:Skav222488  [mRNA]  locus=scaffold1835:93832:95145:- [translate_table: standard]